MPPALSRPGGSQPLPNIKDALLRSNAQSAKVSSLLQLLCKSNAASPLASSMSMNESTDIMEYRQKNLMWRTGFANGAHGEVTDLIVEAKEAAPVELVAGNFQRSASWPIFPSPLATEPRNLWILSPELESDMRAIYPDTWKAASSYAGTLLQIVVLVLVVLTYAACPLTVSWAKMVGSDDEGPIKGRPFKESSVIVISWAFIAAVGFALSFITGGWRSVQRCLDWRAILIFAPAGVGWALADVCEVLAVARIDPATYGIISQARLLGSAAAAWLICRKHHSRLQWGILGGLSLVCMAYCVVPDPAYGGGKYRLLKWRLAQLQLKVKWKLGTVHPPQDQEEALADQMVGLVLALLKVALSVMSGVYAESRFKKVLGTSGGQQLQIQMAQVSFSSMTAALLGYCAICLSQGEDPTAFFSGPDGEWDHRTVLVALMYCWREWICNLCVKRFDSLVKNICNALALVVTYAFTVLFNQETPFSALKVLLLLAVVTEVVNYSATRSQGTSHGNGVQEEGAAASNGQRPPADEIPMHEYKECKHAPELVLKGL